MVLVSLGDGQHFLAPAVNERSRSFNKTSRGINER